MERLKLVILERPQFYEELWSLTGQELRIRYALSPYGLGVLCETHRLPLPPVGYWTRIRHREEFIRYLRRRPEKKRVRR